jgi:hypothetical protein
MSVARYFYLCDRFLKSDSDVSWFSRSPTGKSTSKYRYEGQKIQRIRASRLGSRFVARVFAALIVARAALDKLHTHQVRTSSAAPMLYYTETPVDTSSTAHFRTFLCGKAAATKGSKEKSREFSGSMASRAPA